MNANPDDRCMTLPNGDCVAAGPCMHGPGTGELHDAEIDAIHAQAEDAAVNAVTPHTVVNPYPAGTRQAEIWSYALRSAYAQNNGN